MAAKITTGILVYRIRNDVLQVLLAHAGGPFWVKRDDYAWSVFKGEPEPGEELLDAAKREFTEETGQPFPGDCELIPLGNSEVRGGKMAHVWALEHDYDAAAIVSNTFTMQWPPKSGRMQEFPENDRAEWFDAGTAPQKMFKGQAVFVERLIEAIRSQGRDLDLGNPEETPPVQPSLFEGV